MNEKQIQQGLIDTAGMTGWLSYHTFDSRRSAPGFPDLVLVHAKRGELAFVECKGPRGILSPEQQEWLAALESIADELVLPSGRVPTGGARARRVNVGIANPDTYDSWVSYLIRKENDDAS